MASSFQVNQAQFEKIKGPRAKLELLVEKDYAFAFEAGVYIPERNEVFVTSGPLFNDTGHRRHEITKIQLDTSPVSCEVIPSQGVDMANGGVNYKDGVLLLAPM